VKGRVLVAYFPHMLRDYLMTRGSTMLVVAFVFMGPLLIAFANSNATLEELRVQVLQVDLTLTTFLALVATYGLIGQDFRLGYYRSLFAKTLSVPLYYAALFACALLGFWLVQGVIFLGLIGFGVNGWEPAVASEMTVRFLLLGSMTFAFSRASRLDWIFAVLVMALASPLRSAYPAAESARGRLVNVLLPPMHLFDSAPGARAAGQLSALVTTAGPEWSSLAWIVGYTAVCFTIGLVLARRLPLGSVQ